MTVVPARVTFRTVLGTPIGFLAVLGAWLPTALWLDATQPRAAQTLIGVVTWCLLAAALAAASTVERRQVAIAVVVATGFEVLFAIVWGLYRYRFDNLPLYVPPGHGLIYLAALRIGLLGAVRRHARSAALVVAAVASAWSIGGLLLPANPDVAGATLLPWLLWCLLRSPRAGVYVGAFLATTVLELLGTSFGNWTWADVAPGTWAGQGNPPSAIAGGYCLLDWIVLRIAGLLGAGDREPSSAGARPPHLPLPERA